MSSGDLPVSDYPRLGLSTRITTLGSIYVDSRDQIHILMLEQHCPNYYLDNLSPHLIKHFAPETASTRFYTCDMVGVIANWIDS